MNYLDIARVTAEDVTQLGRLRDLVAEYMWLDDGWSWRQDGKPETLPLPLARELEAIPQLVGDSRNAAYVAYLARAEVGCCALIRSDEDLELKWMYVRESARRCGVARAMLREAERFACERRVSGIRLDVLPARLPAIALYRSADYEVVGLSHLKPVQMTLMRRALKHRP